MDAASGRRLGALRQHLRAVAASTPASAAQPALPEGASTPALTQSLSAEQRSAFLEDGFLIIPFLDAARLEAVRGAVEARVALEGDHGGWEGGHSGVARRLCNLFVKGNVFAALGVEPVMQEAARLAVGRDGVIWNAMNFHDPIPGEVARQHIHADRGFFPSCSGARHHLPAPPPVPPRLSAGCRRRRLLQRRHRAGRPVGGKRCDEAGAR